MLVRVHFLWFTPCTRKVKETDMWNTIFGEGQHSFLQLLMLPLVIAPVNTVHATVAAKVSARRISAGSHFLGLHLLI